MSNSTSFSKSSITLSKSLSLNILISFCVLSLYTTCFYIISSDIIAYTNQEIHMSYIIFSILVLWTSYGYLSGIWNMKAFVFILGNLITFGLSYWLYQMPPDERYSLYLIAFIPAITFLVILICSHPKALGEVADGLDFLD